MARVEDVHKRMVRRIRQLAEERNIALSHIPDRAGVGRAHFWFVLKGERSPTLQWLVRIANALDVDVSDLLVASKR